MGAYLIVSEGVTAKMDSATPAPKPAMATVKHFSLKPVGDDSYRPGFSER